MSERVPTTLPEWESYVNKLAGEPLRSKAINANMQAFVDELLGEGYSMAEVKRIITFFVRQLVATNQAMPGGGAFDLYAIGKADPVAAVGMVLDDEAVEAMAAEPPEESTEDFDADLDQLED